MNAEQNTINGMYGLIKPLVTQETYTDYTYTENMNNMYYGGEGFYALRVLNSFVASSEITANYAAAFLCLDDANISVGNIFIRATTATISVTDGTNNYLNAQYTSSDGINYTLSSITGDNYNATTGIANFSDVYGAIYTGKNQGGEPVPLFTAQFVDFLKPVTVTKTTVEGDATALYQYNNSWNELLDKYKNNIYVQTTAPSTFAGIWIKSNSFTYTNVREITDASAVVASNINILVNPNSAHNYKTIMVDSNIVNGMHYEFDAVYCTDSNGNILYGSPEVYYGNGTTWIQIN